MTRTRESEWKTNERDRIGSLSEIAEEILSKSELGYQLQLI